MAKPWVIFLYASKPMGLCLRAYTPKKMRPPVSRRPRSHIIKIGFNFNYLKLICTEQLVKCNCAGSLCPVDCTDTK